MQFRSSNAFESRTSSIAGRFLSAFVVFALLSLILSACATGKRETPKSPSSETGYYIPRDLDDAMLELDRILGPEGRKEMMKVTEGGMSEYHHGLGTMLRNDWGLWKSSRLATYFNQLGVNHADDMSGIIIKSYWRKLHGKPIDLEGQVRGYQEFWREMRSLEGPKER